LYLIDVASGEAKRLTQNAGIDTEPSFSRLKVANKERPSGDQAGALLEPLKLAMILRLPVANSCT